jgi:PAS domain S-box-containing protein
VVFALIVLLMFLGASFALWYLRDIRTDLDRVSLVEQRMGAVLQVENSILALVNRLHRSADLRNRDQFEGQAAQLAADFRSEISAPALVLQGIPLENNRQAAVIESLNGLLEALPRRVTALIDLAKADDWAALHARLLNQVDRTDDVVAALSREIDQDLVASRQRLRIQVGRAQLRTAEILAATGMFSLVFAGWLGIVVTRSITKPLIALDAGARSLAHGEFGSELAVTGSDELAQLAAVFNQTARELRELYGRLQMSEARFRSLIENASDVILIVTATGRIRYASPSAARVLGQPADKLTGYPIRDLLPPDDVHRADEIFQRMAEQGGLTQSFEWRMRHQDGSFHWMEGVAANLLHDAAVSGIVINARDVSDRRRAEHALRDREEQLRQAQKMEAIGRLAGGVAHDFNNLLTVINGYSDLLLGRLDPADPRHGHARDIYDAGRQAAKLTGQLLAFSRKQMLSPELLNLNDVVHDTESMLRRVIGEDVVLACNLEPNLGAVETDRNQLQQVLMNLAVNARDAMPRGGKLTIATFSSGSEVVLSVNDTGEGMDEATREHVFEPFFTTKKVGKGTGLGLSTVYGIISQSGGRIAVDSELGRGTTFLIYLPRASRAASGEKAAESAPPLTGSETILVVEDQPEVRRLAVHVLQSYGYRVLEAGDAEEALRVSTDFTEPIDVLLTDVVMPGKNGVELSREFLSLRPDVKVIFASGYTDSIILRHGVLDTGATLIPKPYRPSELAAKIREIINR